MQKKTIIIKVYHISFYYLLVISSKFLVSFFLCLAKISGELQHFFIAINPIFLVICDNSPKVKSNFQLYSEPYSNMIIWINVSLGTVLKYYPGKSCSSCFQLFLFHMSCLIAGRRLLLMVFSWKLICQTGENIKFEQMSRDPSI